jgi:ABC-type Mn2+/Zn2+ transport system ATPase subunit
MTASFRLRRFVVSVGPAAMLRPSDSGGTKRPDRLRCASDEAVVTRDLTVRYDDFTALIDATISVHFGEALGVVGPNGSGKSTLLKTLAGLLIPSGGELCVLGSQPQHLPPGSIAYVPQIEAVDWSFPATVWDVVAMGRFPRLPFWRRFGHRDREIVERALEVVNMASLATRHIAHLSGGQQQRVFVARAIAQEPKLLLLDEPTTGVDADTEEALRKLVRDLVAGGMPVVMTTHDLDRVNEWFDRLLVLDRRVLAIGQPDEIAESGVYAGIREHTHTHGHLRTDHEAHDAHATHPEVRR